MVRVRGVYVVCSERVPEVPVRMGRDVESAAWAAGARLGFEAPQLTNRPFQSVGLGLENKGYCSGLWKLQPLNEKSNYGSRV